MEVIQENSEVKQRLIGATALWQQIVASIPEGMKLFEPASEVGSTFNTGHLACFSFPHTTLTYTLTYTFSFVLLLDCPSLNDTI